MKPETILQHEIRMKGYTLRELGEKLNCSAACISSWSNGHYRIGAKFIKPLIKLGFSKKSISNPSKIREEKNE